METSPTAPPPTTPPPTAPPQPPQPAPPPPPLTPSLAAERITALDAVRGVALLGILLVNMRFFAQPVGMMHRVVPPADAAPLDTAAHWFVKIFAEGKFYPLYAMLFGMGLVLMRDRILARGGNFHAAYVRRLAALLLIGVVHAFLLWYGDILIIYSIAGLVLFAFSRAHARTLIITGLALTLVAVFIAIAVMGPLTLLSQNAAAAAATDAPILTEGPPLQRLMEGLTSDPPMQDIADPRWMAYETEAYREGPFFQALGFRAITWISTIIGGFIFAGMAPHVLGMFFLGAGLMKLGIFEPDRAPLRRRFMLAGFALALPVIALAAFAPLVVPEPWGALVLLPVLFLFGPLLSLAYLSSVALVVETGPGRAMFAPIARAGRMGLTCYLLETLLATFVMYWWGLALFGSVSAAEEVGLALLIYAAVLAFANLWLRFAPFGPMEYLWRTATYWRLPRGNKA